MLNKNIFINGMQVCLNSLIHYAPLIIGIIIGLFGLYLSISPKISRTNTINSLKLRSLNGTVISIKVSPNGHGNYHIGILDKIKGDSLEYNLYGYLLFSDKYNIKVGDSVSKDTSSIMMMFHNYQGKGVYEKGIIYKLP